jgi:DNA polymerase III alpha subunit
MINITNRTGFSIRHASGKLDQVFDRQEPGMPVGICDKDSTWGHVQFQKACKKRGVGAIFGVELTLVRDMELREKQGQSQVKLIALNLKGLREIYEAATLATEKFYFHARIDYGFLAEIVSSKNVHSILSNPEWDLVKPILKGRAKKPVSFGLSVNTNPWHASEAGNLALPFVAVQDNLFASPEDRKSYEMIVGGKTYDHRVAPMHILTQGEWEAHTLRYGRKVQDSALALAHDIGHGSQLILPTATLATPEKPETLEAMCRKAAKRRGVNLKNKVYEERLKYELRLIDEKKFEDYFYIVSDLVRYAKSVMLVGPARGSSCGSLVCYLLDITDIDPIPYGLLFERFIDINRDDYPDIDIDFAEDRRHMVYDYLGRKYGYENVAKLGTVSLFKPKSALTDVARDLDIPQWEITELKNSIIERSGGDSRAALCMLDTFQESDVGKRVLEKYPELMICTEMEAHPRHTGVHAAGIVLSNQPTNTYCAIDTRSGAAMIDKKDAEVLNLLKIDALGLRTLSVLQDCLDQIGKNAEWLVDFPRDDQKAFDILNNGRFSGIFQFEGSALKSLVNQMHVDDIEIVIAITALARPGPLASGGTAEYVKRRSGESNIKDVHPIFNSITKPTYGIVVYQEQVMQICRELGKFSWADTSTIRKTMSKTMGKEYFDQFYEKFKKGCAENGMGEEKSRLIWDNINTMGSWAFNRSHAVAYGLVSYWCCALKAHYPVEFALASLRSAKDESQSVQVLRELVNEGFEYVAFDRKLSVANWIAHEGKLIGPLTGVKGIGDKMALDIIEKRAGRNKKPYTKTQQKLLDSGKTPWDSVFACADYWGHLKTEGPKYGVNSAIRDIGDIPEGYIGKGVVVIGQLKKKKTRDANELIKVQQRGGKRVGGQTTSMSLVIEDDTGEIMISISRHNFIRLGKQIENEGKLGDWYMFKGEMREGFRMIFCDRLKKLSDNPEFEKRE